jgi:hypothetical protein
MHTYALDDLFQTPVVDSHVILGTVIEILRRALSASATTPEDLKVHESKS